MHIVQEPRQVTHTMMESRQAVETTLVQYQVAKDMQVQLGLLAQNHTAFLLDELRS